MAKFAVGDRVVCTDEYYGTAFGKPGRILSVDGLPYDTIGTYSVEFDEDIGYHDCGGRGEMGHCLYMNDLNLADYSEPTDWELEMHDILSILI